MALRGVGTVGGYGTTGLTLWVAFAWLIASVYLLVRLAVVFAKLNIADVLEMLGDSGRKEIGRAYEPYSASNATDVSATAPVATTPVIQTLMHQDPPRYVLHVDAGRLVSLARAAEAVIRVQASVGNPVTWGTTIAEVQGSGAKVPEQALREAIVMGRD